MIDEDSVRRIIREERAFLDVQEQTVPQYLLKKNIPSPLGGSSSPHISLAQEIESLEHQTLVMLDRLIAELIGDMEPETAVVQHDWNPSLSELIRFGDQRLNATRLQIQSRIDHLRAILLTREKA